MNMNTVVTDGDCGSACNFGIGSLILSLGITLILVGALFYYVKQRVEVLETSQKEQIHVMQSFIASIGEQFQRMSAYIQEKVVGFGGPRPSTVPIPENPTSDSRITISDSDSTSDSDSDSKSESDSNTDSDSGYESSDNSRSSNTTRDSDRHFDQGTKSTQIKIHDESNAMNTIDTSDSMDNVKIIELTSAQIDHEQDSESEPESSESESESESETISDSESESELGSKEVDKTIPVHVTKIDGVFNSSDTDTSQHQSQPKKKTLTIDLDGGDGVNAPQSQYANPTLTIKQLRQLLKKKNPSLLTNDISKMKREQIIEILQNTK